MNRLIKVSKGTTSLKVVAEYTYDSNGNEIRQTQSNSLTNPTGEIQIGIHIIQEAASKGFVYEEKQYDEYNKLIKFSKNGNILEKYTYRPDGLRLSKKARGTKINHIWDGSNIIADVDDTGNLINNYIRGIEPIKDKDQNYYLYSGHGDVTQITSSAGNVLTKYDYDPFGVDLNRNVDPKNP